MVFGAAEERTRASRRRSVLLLEGDFASRRNVAEYLRRTDYDVFEALNAGQAKAIFGAGTPIDVVVCDVNLTPNLDGHEFLQWVGRRYPKLPVLFTSMDRGAANLINEASTRRFLAKPYVLGNIAQHLSQLIERKRANP
jgi:DNA-binding NtrC family response regulator